MHYGKYRRLTDQSVKRPSRGRSVQDYTKLHKGSFEGSKNNVSDNETVVGAGPFTTPSRALEPQEARQLIKSELSLSAAENVLYTDDRFYI